MNSKYERWKILLLSVKGNNAGSTLDAIVQCEFGRHASAPSSVWQSHVMDCRKVDETRGGTFQAGRSKSSFVVLCSVLILALGSGTGASTENGDWTLARFRAEPTGGKVDFQLSGSIEGDGSGPVVVGFGRGGSAVWARRVSIGVACCGGPAAIVTSATLAGLDVRFSDQPGLRGSFLLTGEAALGPNEELASLVFVANGWLSDVEVTEMGEATGRLTLESGWGSKAIYAVDPNDSGVATAAGRTGAGFSIHAANIPSGIAGAFNHWGCEECLFAWTDPYGRNGRVIQLGTTDGRFGTGNSTFAGASGQWSWTWGGVDAPGPSEAFVDLLSRPVSGAYAPIGASWLLFDPLGT